LTVATTRGATSLSAQQRGWIEGARAQLDQGALGDLVREMTAIPSPTGEEAALAEFLAGHLATAGIDARVQPVGGSQANAIGRLPGSGDGPTLLLYSGIDTPFGGGPDEDAPWLGSPARADWALPPTEQDGKVIGLGADNPKGFAAALVAAAEAVARAGVPLRGDVWIALASGSMPRAGGLGSGISRILDEIGRPDFAILVKPGYAVAHEEVGFAWFRITVRGALNYTGIRHKGPYRNPIVAAAVVVGELEAWFAEYAAANTSGLVAPQGSINAIQAGSADRLAFVPATAQIDVDLRLGPRTTAVEAEAQLRGALDRITTAHPDIELELDRVLALPGTATEPESWIVRSLVAAWEEREGSEHVPLKNGSGASDATVIRARGIPAARIGPPPPAAPNPYPGFSMGQADIASLHALSEILVRAIVDTASRSRSELGA
jgi:succinyl-diaminopimelate desuccinylase